MHEMYESYQSGDTEKFKKWKLTDITGLVCFGTLGALEVSNNVFVFGFAGAMEEAL